MARSLDEALLIKRWHILRHLPPGTPLGQLTSRAELRVREGLLRIDDSCDPLAWLPEHMPNEVAGIIEDWTARQPQLHRGRDATGHTGSSRCEELAAMICEAQAGEASSVRGLMRRYGRLMSAIVLSRMIDGTFPPVRSRSAHVSQVFEVRELLTVPHFECAVNEYRRGSPGCLLTFDVRIKQDCAPSPAGYDATLLSWNGFETAIDDEGHEYLLQSLPFRVGQHLGWSTHELSLTIFPAPKAVVRALTFSSTPLHIRAKAASATPDMPLLEWQLALPSLVWCYSLS